MGSNPTLSAIRKKTITKVVVFFLSFIKNVFSDNIFFSYMDTVAHAVLPHHALCSFLIMHGVSDSITPEDGESASF